MRFNDEASMPITQKYESREGSPLMTQLSTVVPLAPPVDGTPRPALSGKVLHALSVVVAVCVALPLAEGLIRLSNRSMKNYNVEMWRYSKELKTPSANPILGHEHLRNKSAILQSVHIRLNELGMRGGPVPPTTPGKRRIVLLGSSITLGWGVPEEETLAVRLQELFKRDNEDVEVLNAGVGNYNTVRYVELFLTRMRRSKPTDVVVHYFINDAETLEPGGGNFLIRHSQLAVTLWTIAKRYSMGTGEGDLEEHYRRVYAPDAPGYLAMKNALRRLSDYAHEHDIRLHLAMMPDIHNLTDYRFHYIHRLLEVVSGELGYNWVDLYPGFVGLTSEAIWSIPGDPHPNGRGHQIMAEALYPALRRDES